LPNNATKNTKLTAKDWLIYLYIKSYKKSKNATIYPSLEALHKRSGAAINTIRTCIQHLVDAGKIKVIKKGR
jgi:DNA-binding transcriptional regulator PaaX